MKLPISCPEWLPPLISHRDHSGDVDAYVERLYENFKKDFIYSCPFLEGKPVEVKIHPFVSMKEEGFWHIINGKDVFDSSHLHYSRCERITWVKSIIEKHPDPEIKKWERKKNTQNRTYLLLDKYPYSQLVVLINHATKYQLLTSYPTYGKEHDGLKREYEQYRESS